jgi:hypothetical protein
MALETKGIKPWALSFERLWVFFVCVFFLFFCFFLFFLVFFFNWNYKLATHFVWTVMVPVRMALMAAQWHFTVKATQSCNSFHTIQFAFIAKSNTTKTKIMAMPTPGVRKPAQWIVWSLHNEWSACNMFTVYIPKKCMNIHSQIGE